MASEPRTDLEMWRDALELLQDREFRKGFDDRYQRSFIICDECKQKDWDGRTPQHVEDCRMSRALRELAAFVAVESKLEDERREKEESEGA
jgi:hypothetical protein